MRSEFSITMTNGMVFYAFNTGKTDPSDVLESIRGAHALEVSDKVVSETYWASLNVEHVLYVARTSIRRDDADLD